MKLNREYRLIAFVVAFFVNSTLAFANWPDWRGPTGDGRSDATDLPLNWSEAENIVWKTPIHDLGHSTPVVWGDQVWLTTATKDGRTLYAVCIDLNSGRVVHDVEVFHPNQPQRIHLNNSYATPSAVVEEGRAYVHYGTFGTACLDSKTGKVLWRRTDLNCEHMQGPISSPVLFDDLFILHLEGTDVQFIAALDTTTGDTVWRWDRPQELYGHVKPVFLRKAYATPTIIEYQGRRQLISPAAEVTFSYDPKTGEELWRVCHPGWDWNAACRPIFEHGLVYLTTGVSKHLLAVRPSGTGDVTDTHVTWSTRKFVPNMSSPLIVDDLLFMVSDQGYAPCLEAKTGREFWRQRLRAGGDHWASPLYTDGKIYFSGKKGVVSVISAAKDFQLLAENGLDASFIASPAVAGNAIILRSLTNLYCIAEDYETAPQSEIAGKPKPEPSTKVERI